MTAETDSTFELGQEVVDKDGKVLGKVRARFHHYILVEHGGLFVKAYYIPHAVATISKNETILVSLSEEGLREKGLDQVPDDLYVESPELGVPQVDGTAQYARSPLSPAETGHYNYGRRWPGINTDASGSYHREEVLPRPQRVVREFAPDRSKPAASKKKEN